MMEKTIIDKLFDRIRQLKNPSVVGLDTAYDYLPSDMQKANNLKDAAKAIEEFNYNLIDSLYKIVPAVKVQVAYYEMYGHYGMEVFANTLKYAKEKGLFTIADVKRNDIGSTAACYSKAFLGRVNINGKEFTPFESDFVTLNGYLGWDGIKPFIEDAIKYDKGMFILCKTSNPSSGQLQDKDMGGKTLYQTMGELISEWGKDNIGEYGYSRVGAVVGATHPKEAQILRGELPNTLFLVPGYGAQGGTAEDLKYCFDENGYGAIVNSSRGIICAYKTEKYKGKNYASAAYDAALDMQQDIARVITIK